ncbi:Fic family protein [Zooshikella ganghwensis]|uniref:Cell filamentation protein Fic n=1 Tax=Zooshikella ganghwensis TaxID=202772 RepID=A0A4V1IMS4_9GAMM|nr:Fic family protein [Zooshikella ganghwensis]RDH41241.1 cell filamentation protein Fic [Zooshikella ganghwensis]
MATDKHWHITPNKNKALMLAKREIAVFVHDAVALEGIHFTLPEIQTLLEGITVGGYKLSDQQIAVNQGNAWRHLFHSIQQGTFKLNADYACWLHGIAGKEEAIEWGQFRSGGVTIAGTDYMPPQASELPCLFDKMVAGAKGIDDIYDQAIFVFLTMARHRFFYGVNKRMGRLMMNGILLNAGYPAINFPVKRKLEFNQLMLDFYQSGDQGPMNQFMRSCLDDRLITIMCEQCIPN